MKEFKRLHVIAESQTEERFVKDTLSFHLGQFNISTDVRCVLTSKDKRRIYRGGLINYAKAKSDITMWLKEDHNPDARFTTMFDLYALPDDFPKYEESKKINNAYQHVEFLENAFAEDIQANRFIPYIQLYEFESLILSNPEVFEIEYFEHCKEIKSLKQILTERVIRS